jgi:hypothetical protein
MNPGVKASHSHFMRKPPLKGTLYMKKLVTRSHFCRNLLSGKDETPGLVPVSAVAGLFRTRPWPK